MTKPIAPNAEPRCEAAEFVLPGHPDKLCDAAVDAVVDYVRRWDPVGQCGLEAGCIFDRFFMTGRIAVRDIRVAERLQDGELHKLVRGAYASAGYGEDAAGHVWGPRPEELRIAALKSGTLRIGRFEDGEAELRHLSDDQAICVGHAVRGPATNFLPPAHWLARRTKSTTASTAASHSLSGWPGSTNSAASRRGSAFFERVFVIARSPGPAAARRGRPAFG